jgi:exopolyphosphatase/guanosine-5'-triphosphate,3'-diphosphate pyrophosphatase
MGRRYGVVLDHARKVGKISNLLFTALQPLHQLPPGCGKLLEAAAHLLDVGHYVSSSSHHKHSYYVVSNSDMPGFTERERILIANLCRYHRKSMPNPMHSSYQNLPPEEKRTLLLMIPLLRLADNLDRSHEHRIEKLECRWRDAEVSLQVTSHGDIDLEQWGAERASEVFKQVYNRQIVLTKARETQGSKP